MDPRILTYVEHAELLEQRSEPVEHGERCRELVDAMFEAMAYPLGIGLAAPQIGERKRIIICQVPHKKGSKLTSVTKHVIINPVITWQKGQMVLGREGCLSFPGDSVLVPRWPRITVEGFDLRWNPIKVGAKGLVARVLQHEIDHLDGVTLETYVRVAKEAFEEQDREQQTSNEDKEEDKVDG